MLASSFDKNEIPDFAINDQHTESKLLLCAVEPIILDSITRIPRKESPDAPGSIGSAVVIYTGMELWKKWAERIDRLSKKALLESVISREHRQVFLLEWSSSTCPAKVAIVPQHGACDLPWVRPP